MPHFEASYLLAARIPILRCESSLCEFVKKPRECYNIRNCISNIIVIVNIIIAVITIVIIMILTEKKMCSAKKSCACTHGFCHKPWWAEGPKGTIERACRNDQVQETDIL